MPIICIGAVNTPNALPMRMRYYWSNIILTNICSHKVLFLWCGRLSTSLSSRDRESSYLLVAEVARWYKKTGVKKWLTMLSVCTMCNMQVQLWRLLAFLHSHTFLPPTWQVKKSWGKKLKTTQVQCIQLHDLCKLCIQHVFANCTEWL